MNVKMFHLIDGKDIIAEVLGENEVLKNPFEFIFTPQGAGLIPFMAMAKDHVISYPEEDHIMFECEAADNLLAEYTKAVNPSAIQVQEKPGLLVPG